MLVWMWACGIPAQGVEPAAPEPEPVVEEAPPVAPAPEPVVEPFPAEGPFRRELLPGLVVAAYLPPEIDDIGYARPSPEVWAGADERLFVVTVDPARSEVVYRSKLAGDAGVGTADSWAREHGLVVAFNPGMFEPGAEATGYTRTSTFVSQPAVRRQSLYRSFFVVEGGKVDMLDIRPPSGSGKYAPVTELPAALRSRLEGADFVAQSLSILRDGAPAYPPRKNQWSELAYGVDDQGRLVVVFSRRPYEMRELGARVAALGLGIRDLLHGEGGPEASLVVRVEGLEWFAVGSYETGFFGNSNRRLWGLPAVLGVRPK